MQPVELCTANQEGGHITKATGHSFLEQQSIPVSAVELCGCVGQLPVYRTALKLLQTYYKRT